MEYRNQSREVEDSGMKGNAPSRRTYLASLGGFGFAGLPLLNRSRDNKVTIVTARSGDRPIETEEVSKQWYDQMIKARKVATSFREEHLLSNNGILAIGLTSGDDLLGARREHAIDIKLRGNKASINIPSDLEGVPVNVTRNNSFKGQNLCYTDAPLQGGVNILTGETSGYAGTACCRVKRDGNYYLLTAKHTFVSGGPCSTGDPIGDPVYRNGTQIATIDDQYSEHDSVIAQVSSNQMSDSIVGESGSIDGHYTKDGVANIVSSSDSSAEKRGISTCHEDITVTAYDEYISCENNKILTEWVVSEGAGKSGDSGGPVYRNDSLFKMVNMHSAINTKTGELGGPGAYGLHNFQDLKFDT